MKKSRILLLLISIMVLCFTFGLIGCAPSGDDNGGDGDGNNGPQAPTFLSTIIVRGEVTVMGGESDCVSYKVYAGGEEVASSTSKTINVIDGIKNTFGANECYGEFDLDVEGYDASGNLVKATENSTTFNVIALNQQNFKETLENPYTSNDYFMFEDDINLYGVYDSRMGAVALEGVPTGFTAVSMLYCPVEYGHGSIANVINRPLDAMVDGNGFTLNFWVDERMPYYTGWIMGVGGIFNKVSLTGGISNLYVNLDVLYVQRGGTYTGPFIYREAQGEYSNLFVNGIFRPIVAYDEAHQYNNRDGDCPLVYDDDMSLALIGSSYNATYTDCVFSIQVYDHEGKLITKTLDDKSGLYHDAGGVFGDMGYTETPVVLNNCVLIQNSDTPHFTNQKNLFYYYESQNGEYVLDEFGNKIIKLRHRDYRASANNVYFYKTLDDFVNGTNGYVINGLYEKGSNFTSATDTALEHLSCFEKKNNKVYFMEYSLVQTITYNKDFTESKPGK